MSKLLFGTDDLLRLLNSLGIRPGHGGLALALTVSIGETLLGVCLATGFRERVSSRAAVGVLLLFSTFLVIAGFRLGWRTQCGCGFVSTVDSIQIALLRNAALLACAFLLVRLHGERSLARGGSVLR
ncbi:MAG: hypothetical protein HUU22_03725 [Phycisphaerae bacterium]|nr:hypothetical protein [Phycisphaerae bacterium]